MPELRQERAVSHLAFPVTETHCMQAYGWKRTKTSGNNHFSFREHSGGHEALFAAPPPDEQWLCAANRETTSLSRSLAAASTRGAPEETHQQPTKS